MERLTDAARAAEILRLGGVVAFPTDTVYGLAAATPEAARRIYELKGRPEAKPLVLMAADAAHLVVRADVGPRVGRMMRRYWPGPLTLVVPTAEGPVGMRVPDHALARELLAAAGPLWTTSANRSGEPEAMTADEAAAQLPDLDAVLDGGRAPGGTPSTVLDVSGEYWKVLREGAIPRSEFGL